MDPRILSQKSDLYSCSPDTECPDMPMEEFDIIFQKEAAQKNKLSEMQIF
jgi:hypothetical protein